MVKERSSVRPPEVMIRFGAVYVWPEAPPDSQTVVRVVVFDAFAASMACEALDAPVA
jgi:hypothetical protein